MRFGFAVFPAMFWGMYTQVGQAIAALNHMYSGAVTPVSSIIDGNWHYWRTELLSLLRPMQVGGKMPLGATYFLPIYATVFITVGGFWEVLFLYGAC
ncbi:hypothetical protein O9929_04000 [Vibrio lentus]|nr:hypothetical protein [Vibrio lentus]